MRASGIDRFRADTVAAAPILARRIDAVAAWNDVKLLTVSLDRLTRWHRPGLLAIGDAAHAMSPVGGVGINLAIQDAVATANILAEKLQRNEVTDDDLDAVRERRLFPAKVIQAIQVQIHNRVIGGALGGALRPPLPLRLISAVPLLQRLVGRLLAMGVRPEHVHSPQA